MGVEKSKTLCWNCANATDGRKCEWARDGIPVKGWEAYPTTNFYFDSYCVLSCPKFVSDAGTKPKHDAEMMSVEMSSKIIEEIVDRAIRDWKWADRYLKGKRRVWKETQITPDALKQNVEKFFRGRWFKAICGDLDGESIIIKLQRGEI